MPKIKDMSSAMNPTERVRLEKQPTGTNHFQLRPHQFFDCGCSISDFKKVFLQPKGLIERLQVTFAIH